MPQLEPAMRFEWLFRIDSGGALHFSVPVLNMHAS